MAQEGRLPGPGLAGDDDQPAARGGFYRGEVFVEGGKLLSPLEQDAVALRRRERENSDVRIITRVNSA
jgi:hypothetical protein